MTISLRAIPTWFVLIIAGLLIAGCGGSDNDAPAPASSAQQSQSQSSPAPEPEPAPTPEPEPAPAPTEEVAMTQPAAETVSPDEAVTVDDDGVAQVTIGSTDQMQYTVREFTVDAGQEVELTLVHEGQLAVQVMGHNVVILPAGGDYMAFSRQVMNEGGSVDNDYLPEGMRDGLVAYTSLIGGGETDTIRFTAPDEPGEYPFVCTFPGHFGMMNGVMTVR